MTDHVPDIITTYQLAHDRHDIDAALATFSPDATVVDDGRTHVGTAEIRAWLDRTTNEFTYTRSLTGADDHGDGAYTVRNHLAGNFPGGQVDLRYRFELRDDLIQSLHSAP